MAEVRAQMIILVSLDNDMLRLILQLIEWVLLGHNFCILKRIRRDFRIWLLLSRLFG